MNQVMGVSGFTKVGKASRAGRGPVPAGSIAVLAGIHQGTPSLPHPGRDPNTGLGGPDTYKLAQQAGDWANRQRPAAHRPTLPSHWTTEVTREQVPPRGAQHRVALWLHEGLGWKVKGSGLQAVGYL